MYVLIDQQTVATTITDLHFYHLDNGGINLLYATPHGKFPEERLFHSVEYTIWYYIGKVALDLNAPEWICEYLCQKPKYITHPLTTNQSQS